MYGKELEKYDIRSIDYNIRCGKPSIVTINYNSRKKHKIKLNIIETLNIDNITLNVIISNDRKLKLKKLKKKI